MSVQVIKELLIRANSKKYREFRNTLLYSKFKQIASALMASEKASQDAALLKQYKYYTEGSKNMVPLIYHAVL